jgi:hypothetical protein
MKYNGRARRTQIKDEQFGCSKQQRNDLWGKYVEQGFHQSKQITFLAFCQSKNH